MKPEKLHNEIIIFDGHCDTALDLKGLGRNAPGGHVRSFYEESALGHVDYPRLKKAGVTCQTMALWTPDDRLDRAREYSEELSRRIDGLYGEDVIPALKASDIRRAKKERKLALLKSMEGGAALEGRVEDLRLWHERGVRMIGLIYNRVNPFGRGCGSPGNTGLTELGKEAVAEMARLGIMTDVSHLSDESFDDLLEISELPVVASHSDSRAVFPHPRSLTDRQLERIAASGGVAGLTFPGIFLSDRPEEVSFRLLMNHLEHMISVAGIDHVGLGSDFDGYDDTDGIAMTSVLDLNRITAYLQETGRSEEEIAKVMGGNWLRVMEAVCG
jgi:membrane dipeptidase